ncbi:MAG: T9SS type A sorting domain-containing protein [Bacteroidota bacterium]
MKKVLLLGFALILGLAVVTQAQFRNVHSLKPSVKNAISIDPVATSQASTVTTPLPNQTKSANIVSVITLGTAANALGWGYAAGTYDHVWADQDLGTVSVIHRMGPGTTPPSFSGYLAMDHAANRGATAADWLINYQVYGAFLNAGGTYYQDACRYPSGGMYNPAGNVDPNNSYLVYFAPNMSYSGSGTWGGYSYGRSKWGSQGDTTKHMNWYAPPPQRYGIPEGFFISAKGTAFAIDRGYDATSAINENHLYLSTGTWSNTTNDYSYTFSLIPLVSQLGTIPAICKVAADPSGNHVWVCAIGNNGGASPVFDSTYYPIFYHSSDGGLTWSDAKAVTLDGPNGIPAILNYISDYRLDSVYRGAANVPPRDQIAYTTAFDGDLTVDKWGNAHFAVAVAFPGGGFSIVSPDGNNSPRFDSTMAIFDIFTVNHGTSFCGRMMGVTKRFRCDVTSSGAASYIDLRTNISRNAAGDKVFVSYQDTWLASVASNNAPDIFARGWDLVQDKLTNNSGQDAATNVTYLSDITQTAYCPDQAQLTFTKPDGSSLIPFVAEMIDNATLDNPVTFKYVPDFSFPQSAFTINGQGPSWGSNCDFPVGITESAAASTLSASIYPNPVKSQATVKVVVPVKGAITIQITNLVGQTVMSLTKNVETTDTFTLDASQLNAGVYFYTVRQGSQKVTGKIIVE